MGFPSSFLLDPQRRGYSCIFFFFSPLFSILFFETLGLCQLCQKLSTLSPPREIRRVLPRIWRPCGLSLNLIRTSDFEDREMLRRWRVVSGRGKDAQGGLSHPRACEELKEAKDEASPKAARWMEGQVSRTHGVGVSLGCGSVQWHSTPCSEGLRAWFNALLPPSWNCQYFLNKSPPPHRVFILHWIPQILEPALRGYEIQLCHLLARRAWGNPLASVRLSFCFWKMESRILPSNTPSWGLNEIMNNWCIVE